MKIKTIALVVMAALAGASGRAQELPSRATGGVPPQEELSPVDRALTEYGELIEIACAHAIPKVCRITDREHPDFGKLLPRERCLRELWSEVWSTGSFGRRLNFEEDWVCRQAIKLVGKTLGPDPESATESES